MSRLVTEVADSLRPSILGRIPGGFGTREAEAFRSGSGVSRNVWLLGTDENAWIAPSTPPPSEVGPPISLVVAGSAADPLFIMSRARDGLGYETALVAQAFLASGEPASEPEEVLDIFNRVTSENAVALSADGERVAVGNGHPGTTVPHFALLDKKAHKLGEAQLYERGDSLAFDCFTLTGTEHGALGSVVDATTGTLHIVELDATGEARAALDWPMPDELSCPAVSADPTGIYFSFHDKLPEAGPRGLTVYRLASGALSQVARLPPSDADPVFSWVAGGASPLVEIRSSSGSTFARWKDDTLIPLTGGPFPTARTPRIPSTEGRIFLTQEEAGELQIREIVCGTGAP
ncbi:hypothetical protein [Sorangium sp. So ce341]|uniref:hypothetical protein n=1 Tax=Sorangium sp. So ce341 TaxID=3133302 RepID=UPI003F5DAC38